MPLYLLCGFVHPHHDLAVLNPDHVVAVLHPHHNVAVLEPQHGVAILRPDHVVTVLQPHHIVAVLEPQHGLANLHPDHGVAVLQPQMIRLSLKHSMVWLIFSFLLLGFGSHRTRLHIKPSSMCLWFLVIYYDVSVDDRVLQWSHTVFKNSAN